MTYVIFKNLAGSTSRNGSMSTTLSFLEIYTWSIRIKLNRKWSFFKEAMPNKDDNKWSNEGQKGGKNQKQDLVHLADWGILPWGSFCREQKWISIGCFPFSAWGQIGIKIVRFDPPMLDLKYLLDTGTIRLLMACSLDHS